MGNAVFGPESRYFIQQEHLGEVFAELEDAGFRERCYPEKFIQTVYCATVDGKTPKSSDIRLRRYVPNYLETISPQDTIIVEAKRKSTSSKYRRQIEYGNVVLLLRKPAQLLGEVDSLPVIRADWPQSQDEVSSLDIALRELELRPLYPVAGTLTYRRHFHGSLESRVTVDANIRYFGVFAENVNRLVRLGDEGNLCKVEFKGDAHSLTAKTEELLLELGGRVVGENEQEIKMRKLYVARLSGQS